MIEVEIYADGGHEKNGSYGSFVVFRLEFAGKSWVSRIRWLEISRASLPEETTSNEAEYRIHILAVWSLFKALGENPEAAENYAVTIFSDSQLLVNQLNGEWKVRAANLAPLRDDLLSLLLVFGEWKAEWVPRERMVALFGH